MENEEYNRMYEVESAHWWYVSLHALVLGTVMREHRRRGPLAMLDAGCGTGRLLQLLSPYGTAEGCDVSEAALSFCRARGLERVRRADLNTADLGQDRFDVITSLDVLYHRLITDDQLVLGSLYRSLRPGGLLVLQVPAYEWLRSDHDRAVHTARRYVRSSVTAMLRAAGFRPERCTYRVCLLFPAVALARLGQKLMGAMGRRTRGRSDVEMPPLLMNDTLARLQLAENAVLERISLPFGVSIFAVARRPVVR